MKWVVGAIMATAGLERGCVCPWRRLLSMRGAVLLKGPFGFPESLETNIACVRPTGLLGIKAGAMTC